MADIDDRINQLSDKLESLLQRQVNFSHAIFELKNEINQLKNDSVKIAEEIIEPIQEEIVEAIQEDPVYVISEEDPVYEPQKISIENIPETPPVSCQRQTETKSNLEKFIGENLISKIGIVILVIGVAIGTKYAIEHQWITPLMRIILGYMIGGGLLGFAFKFKKKYENLSAVLLSGASAIMYFITYFAYAFYDLIPQIPTFGLMVVFTAFTVGAAIHYNRQIIAHIGLVGAYAVPFLLSDGSGRIAVLLSYMAIINTGILLVSIKKYWKPLFYVSFGLTWLIYFSWYNSDYQSDSNFGLALTFLILFFIIFYVAFLGYKFIKNEKFTTENIVLLIANSFIFYGLGYGILEQHPLGTHFLGLFTFCNAILHCLISILIYQRKLLDKSLFYLTFGLMLVFATITIPVQFSGNWVTLLWTGEALLMFWIGRKKQVSMYELLSYPLIILSFISLMHDWSNISYHEFTPILNIHCLTSVLFIAAFGWIALLIHKNKTSFVSENLKNLSKIISFLVPAMLVFTTYVTFFLEIDLYYLKPIKWGSMYKYDYDQIMNFKTIWLLNYSLFFVSALSFINLKKIKNQILGYASIVLNIVAILVFLTQGLIQFGNLRDYYLDPSVSTTALNIGIRYISFAFVALTVYVSFLYTKASFMEQKSGTLFEILFSLFILWIASSEFIYWMEMFISKESYKIGLSILWGTYALLLIILGIWKKKKHLRISAMVLFGVTLIKLFAYDIAHVETIAKTIVFVSLGVILLIISFLYNKYKHLISDENQESTNTETAENARN